MRDHSLDTRPVRAIVLDPEGFVRALAGIDEVDGRERPIEPFEAVAIEDATGGASAARAAGMRVAAIRGLGCDPASGHVEVVIDRLDPATLEAIMDLATRGRPT